MMPKKLNIVLFVDAGHLMKYEIGSRRFKTADFPKARKEYMIKTSAPGKDPESNLLKILCLFDDDFSIDWIVSLTGLKPSAVLRELERGVDEGWLAKASAGRFTFLDSPKKMGIRSGMSPSETEILFRKIAGLFLDEDADGAQEPALLARFLLRISNDEAGCRGLLLAGDAFVKNYQPDKALECYLKLKDDLSRLTGKTADDLFIAMAIKTSKIATARQSTKDVVEMLENALERAQRKKDPAAQALIQMHIAKNEWLLNHFDRALKIFHKGWELAGRCRDEKLLRSAKAFHMYFSFWQGRFRDVVHHYEQSVADVAKHPQSGFPLLATITVGQCYAYLGQITQGLGMLDAIRDDCRDKGDMHMAAFAVGSINAAVAMICSLDETLDYVNRTYVEIKQSANHYIELLTEEFLAYLYYRKGDTTRSVEYLKKFIAKCTALNIDTLHHTPHLLELCWAMEQEHYPRILGLSLEKEVLKLLRGQNVFLKGLAHRYQAFLNMRANRPSKDILRSLALSLECLETSGHEFEIQKTRMELLRHHLHAGDHNAAKAIRSQIEDVFSHYHEDVIPSDLKATFGRAPSDRTYLAEILKFGRDLGTLADHKDLLQRIIACTNQLTGAERGAIFLLDNNAQSSRLTLRASKNLTHEHVDAPAFQASVALMEQVASEGVHSGPLIRHDTDAENRREPSSGDFIRSCICAPILFKNRIIGVLYHDNRLLDSVFDESDFKLLTFFAAQAAVVLDNIAVHEKFQTLKQKIHEEEQYAEEPHYPRNRFGGIIGKSDAIRQTLYLVEQVAGMDTNVLILGETGVGKDLVANAIHEQSARRGKPFIKANCSALTETLINSELFGHERGAFTGANSRRSGRFELADTGTIFLDEIGDLPLGVQANLLRVLQNHEFERVGGNETIRSDFRLIAATNSDLKRLVDEKLFRADLYFRLNVFPVRVPPLRERKEDIPLLVHHFVRHYAHKLKKDIQKIPSSEMNKFMRYDWPGNVRELENEIERGVVLSAPPVFSAPDLDAKMRPSPKDQPVQSLADNERNHILWALEQKGWKIRGPEGVAEFLNIHPSTLAARMRKLHIQRPPKRG